MLQEYMSQEAVRAIIAQLPEGTRIDGGIAYVDYDGSHKEISKTFTIAEMQAKLAEHPDWDAMVFQGEIFITAWDYGFCIPAEPKKGE